MITRSKNMLKNNIEIEEKDKEKNKKKFVVMHDLRLQQLEHFSVLDALFFSLSYNTQFVFAF
jgi:hypothetical protein